MGKPMSKSKLVILVEKLLKQGKSTAGKDVGISNANQYYIELENKGITAYRWVCENGIRYKERFIKDRAKAYEFLAKNTKKTPKIAAET